MKISEDISRYYIWRLQRYMKIYMKILISSLAYFQALLAIAVFKLRLSLKCSYCAKMVGTEGKILHFVYAGAITFSWNIFDLDVE